MRHPRKKAAAFIAMVFAAGSFPLASPGKAADVPESEDPIKLAINEWTGQHITTHIAGQILERMGYNVEYVTAGYYPQMEALQDNTVTATLEIWLNTIGEHYDKALQSGKVDDLGELGLAPSEGWLYPTYVEGMCPGLPDWSALKDCAEIFATAETLPKGRLIDYPADWGGNNKERIDAFELDLVAQPAGTEGSMIAEFQSAVARKAPILMMFWSPHWILGEYETKFVEMPAYDAKCVDDPSWGVNSDKTYDCAWFTGHVKKLVWKDMKDKWPAAYRFLELYHVANEDQIPLMKAIDVEGQDLVETTKAWVSENESKWQPWVDAAMSP